MEGIASRLKASSESEWITAFTNASMFVKWIVNCFHCSASVCKYILLKMCLKHQAHPFLYGLLRTLLKYRRFTLVGREGIKNLINIIFNSSRSYFYDIDWVSCARWKVSGTKMQLILVSFTCLHIISNSINL